MVVSIESWPTANIDKRTFQHAIWTSTSRLFGDNGAATADLFLIRFEFSDGSGWGIIRTPRDALHMAKSSLACISQINEFPIGILIKGVSGTIKTCEEKYLSDLPTSIVSKELFFNNKLSSCFIRENSVDIKIDNDFIGATHLDVT